MKYNSPVSIEKILAYPTVKTGCIMCDAVAETLLDTRIKEGKVLAARMGVRSADLSAAMRVQTGMSMKDLLRQIRILKIRAYLLSHPHEDKSSVASRFGFSDRKYLYQFIDHYIRLLGYEVIRL